MFTDSYVIFIYICQADLVSFIVFDFLIEEDEKISSPRSALYTKKCKHENCCNLFSCMIHICISFSVYVIFSVLLHDQMFHHVLFNLHII